MMRLVNPETINLWVGLTPVGPAEIWNRCTPISALPFTYLGLKIGSKAELRSPPLPLWERASPLGEERA
jgi:hypothetical protein